MRLFFFAAMGLVACSGESSDTPAVEDASVDTVVADSATVDSATNETVTVDTATDAPAVDSFTADVDKPDVDKPDVAKTDAEKTDAGRCLMGSDCLLFSSYCKSDPCKCIPLLKGEADPKCEGGTVACLVDPCAGKVAICTGGMCGMSP
jgi:hypothetical protein